MGEYYIPTVFERDGRTERSWDVYSRLLKDRIVFIGTPITDGVANAVIAQLLFLQMEDSKKDVHIYINSPGGSLTAGMAIYDTMKFLHCDVVTYCVGQAASMATILLAAGTKGKRYSLPNSRVMISRHLHCRKRNSALAQKDKRDSFERHGQTRRTNRKGLRPRLLYDRRRSRKIRHCRQGYRKKTRRPIAQ